MGKRRKRKRADVPPHGASTKSALRFASNSTAKFEAQVCRDGNGKKRKATVDCSEINRVHSAGSPPGPSSLVQQLKKYRGIAASTPPPPKWTDENAVHRPFLTPTDDPQAFNSCQKRSFSGFHYECPSSLPVWLHREFDESFRELDESGLFLYDAVQPGKKRLTMTSVKRTLVGHPGSTYKYLGLRLFSHPWSDVDENGSAIEIKLSKEIAERDEAKEGSTLQQLGYSEKETSTLITIGRINKFLAERSKAMLEKFISPNVKPKGLVGSAEFNLTLINRMEPTSTKQKLKKELTYKMGKTSVGWHRDSGLKDFSSIAVYQLLRGSDSANSNGSWGVAMRAMAGGKGGPLASIPALLVPLPSGSVYYMLDDFNHNHEHAVIAGPVGLRYSSTHRVAREGQGTWPYIRGKIENFLSSSGAIALSGITEHMDSNCTGQKQSGKQLTSAVRALQNLMTEIEFEWLRQWFVQGQKHALLHPYWHRPIDFLTKVFCKLEKMCICIIKLLRRSTMGGVGAPHVTEDLFDVLIDSFTHRLALRVAWRERYKDPVFSRMPEDERPFTCSCLDRRRGGETDKPGVDREFLTEDLGGLISEIREWRTAFVNSSLANRADAGRRKVGQFSLTRKEQKHRASNWERLKSTLATSKG